MLIRIWKRFCITALYIREDHSYRKKELETFLPKLSWMLMIVLKGWESSQLRYLIRVLRWQHMLECFFSMTGYLDLYVWYSRRYLISLQKRWRLLYRRQAQNIRYSQEGLVRQRLTEQKMRLHIVYMAVSRKENRRMKIILQPMKSRQ